MRQEHQNGDNEESLTQHSATQQNLSYSHGLVPKTRDFADSFSTIDEDAPTTLMIRNIPNYYSQKELADEIDSLGFKGTYNFLYLPMDRKTNGRLAIALLILSITFGQKSALWYVRSMCGRNRKRGVSVPKSQLHTSKALRQMSHTIEIKV